jgi:hypothetical protein
MQNRTVEFFPGDDKNEDVEAHVQPPKDLDVERF